MINILQRTIYFNFPFIHLNSSYTAWRGISGLLQSYQHIKMNIIILEYRKTYAIIQVHMNISYLELQKPLFFTFV